ncbi:MAG: type II toxin-antitoxin system Phd/YefM family antitoxin [Armatimonadota bacterium]
MKTATISDLKAKLSDYVETVIGGEEVIVTKRGRPVARLAPIEGRIAEDERLSRLVARGLVRPAKRSGGILDILPLLREDATDVALEVIQRVIREERDDD